MAARPFTIAHLSDLHCGSPYFVANLLERAIKEINRLEPDVVVCSGDLTTFGYKQEYRDARGYLDRLDCPDVITIPGNHDSRNVGYTHFEQLIGPRSTVLRKAGITFVAVDSSEPDLDHGTIGRGRYTWITEQFAPPADFRVFVLHHHLLPIPGTGRERNVVHDAGDTLEVLQQAGVNLVLSGTSTCPMRGGSRICSWSTRARCPRCGCAATPGPVTTWSRSPPTRCTLPAVPVSRPRADRALLSGHAHLREVLVRRRGGDRGRTLALVDGEHHPAVVRAALAKAGPGDRSGGRAAAGWRREAGRRPRLRLSAGAGRPVTPAAAMVVGGARAPRRRGCSTSPTSRCSRRPGGSGWSTTRSPRASPTAVPTSTSAPPARAPVGAAAMAVIGTGKRIGKTAVSAHTARLLVAAPAAGWSWSRWDVAGRPADAGGSHSRRDLGAR